MTFYIILIGILVSVVLLFYLKRTHKAIEHFNTAVHSDIQANQGNYTEKIDTHQVFVDSKNNRPGKICLDQTGKSCLNTQTAVSIFTADKAKNSIDTTLNQLSSNLTKIVVWYSTITNQNSLQDYLNDKYYAKSDIPTKSYLDGKYELSSTNPMGLADAKTNYLKRNIDQNGQRYLTQSASDARYYPIAKNGGNYVTKLRAANDYEPKQGDKNDFFITQGFLFQYPEFEMYRKNLQAGLFDELQKQENEYELERQELIRLQREVADALAQRRNNLLMHIASSQNECDYLEANREYAYIDNLVTRGTNLVNQMNDLKNKSTNSNIKKIDITDANDALLKLKIYKQNAFTAKSDVNSKFENIAKQVQSVQELSSIQPMIDALHAYNSHLKSCKTDLETVKEQKISSDEDYTIIQTRKAEFDKEVAIAIQELLAEESIKTMITALNNLITQTCSKVEGDSTLLMYTGTNTTATGSVTRGGRIEELKSNLIIAQSFELDSAYAKYLLDEMSKIITTIETIINDVRKEIVGIETINKTLLGNVKECETLYASKNQKYVETVLLIQPIYRKASDNYMTCSTYTYTISRHTNELGRVYTLFNIYFKALEDLKKKINDELVAARTDALTKLNDTLRNLKPDDTTLTCYINDINLMLSSDPPASSCTPGVTSIGSSNTCPSGKTGAHKMVGEIFSQERMPSQSTGVPTVAASSTAEESSTSALSSTSPSVIGYATISQTTAANTSLRNIQNAYSTANTSFSKFKKNKEDILAILQKLTNPASSSTTSYNLASSTSDVIKLLQDGYNLLSECTGYASQIETAYKLAINEYDIITNIWTSVGCKAIAGETLDNAKRAAIQCIRDAVTKKLITIPPETTPFSCTTAYIQGYIINDIIPKIRSTITNVVSILEKYTEHTNKSTDDKLKTCFTRTAAVISTSSNTISTDIGTINTKLGGSQLLPVPSLSTAPSCTQIGTPTCPETFVGEELPTAAQSPCGYIGAKGIAHTCPTAIPSVQTKYIGQFSCLVKEAVNALHQMVSTLASILDNVIGIDSTLNLSSDLQGKLNAIIIQINQANNTSEIELYKQDAYTQINTQLSTLCEPIYKDVANVKCTIDALSTYITSILEHITGQILEAAKAVALAEIDAAITAKCGAGSNCVIPHETMVKIATIKSVHIPQVQQMENRIAHIFENNNIIYNKSYIPNDDCNNIVALTSCPTTIGPYNTTGSSSSTQILNHTAMKIEAAKILKVIQCYGSLTDATKGKLDSDIRAECKQFIKYDAEIVPGIQNCRTSGEITTAIANAKTKIDQFEISCGQLLKDIETIHGYTEKLHQCMLNMIEHIKKELLVLALFRQVSFRPYYGNRKVNDIDYGYLLTKIYHISPSSIPCITKTVLNKLSIELTSVPSSTGPKMLFTNCGATGSTGPALQQCTNTYNNSTFSNANVLWKTDISVDNNFKVQNGIQEWTIKTPGTYKFTIAGARGGSYGTGTTAVPGGNGKKGIVTISGLEAGDIIKILVGQPGINCGGGGASCVTLTKKATGQTSIIGIAGGGGGSSYSVDNRYISGLPAQNSTYSIPYSITKQNTLPTVLSVNISSTSHIYDIVGKLISNNGNYTWGNRWVDSNYIWTLNMPHFTTLPYILPYAIGGGGGGYSTRASDKKIYDNLREFIFGEPGNTLNTSGVGGRARNTIKNTNNYLSEEEYWQPDDPPGRRRPELGETAIWGS